MNHHRMIPTSDPHLRGVIPTQRSAMIPTCDPHFPALPPIGGSGEVGITGSDGLIPIPEVGITGGDHAECLEIAGILGVAFLDTSMGPPRKSVEKDASRGRRGVGSTFFPLAVCGVPRSTLWMT
jgi:hypothetical protein